jgi:hypothetical protein
MLDDVISIGNVRPGYRSRSVVTWSYPLRVAEYDGTAFCNTRDPNATWFAPRRVSSI